MCTTPDKNMDLASSTMATAIHTSTVKHTGLAQMQGICEKHEDSMRGHYEWLAQQVVRFQHDKISLLEQMQRSLRKPEEDVSAAIQGMMPESLRHLLALVMANQDPVEEGTASQQSQQFTGNVFQIIDAGPPVLPLAPTPSTRAPIPLPRPVTSYLAAKESVRQPAQPLQPVQTVRPVQPVQPVQPTQPNKPNTPNKPNQSSIITAAPRPLNGGKPGSGSQKTMASYFANKTVAPAENYFTHLQRSRRLEDKEASHPAPKKPRLEPVLPPIHDWEVEATEYVFEYAQFGPGWFVLRCDRGMDLEPVKFTSYPLLKSGRALGLLHFRDNSCRHHKHKTYTEEAMMVAYAQRVVDNDDADVTADWAVESNDSLIENARRREREKTRRRERRKPVVIKMEPEENKAAVCMPGRASGTTSGSSLFDPLFLDDDDDGGFGEDDAVYSPDDEDDDGSGESSQSSESTDDELEEEFSDDCSV